MTSLLKTYDFTEAMNFFERYMLVVENVRKANKKPLLTDEELESVFFELALHFDTHRSITHVDLVKLCHTVH